MYSQDQPLYIPYKGLLKGDITNFLKIYFQTTRIEELFVKNKMDEDNGYTYTLK